MQALHVQHLKFDVPRRILFFFLFSLLLFLFLPTDKRCVAAQLGPFVSVCWGLALCLGLLVGVCVCLQAGEQLSETAFKATSGEKSIRQLCFRPGA